MIERKSLAVLTCDLCGWTETVEEAFVDKLNRHVTSDKRMVEHRSSCEATLDVWRKTVELVKELERNADSLGTDVSGILWRIENQEKESLSA